MEYLRRVLRQLLKEEASQDKIMDAVKKKYEVVINYDSGGPRVIQPAVYGTSTAGNMVLRAYQTGGFTKTHVPAWKEFIIDKIDDWKPNKDVTFEEPPSFSKSDAGLSNVFVTSDFEGEKDNFYSGKLRDFKNSSKKDNSQNVSKGNQSSLDDMARANNFGDEQGNYTSGPVTKGNTETPDNVASDTKVDYSNVAKNGPVFRGEEQYKEPSQEYKNQQNKEARKDNDEPDIDFEKEMEKDVKKEEGDNQNNENDNEEEEI